MFNKTLKIGNKTFTYQLMLSKRKTAAIYITNQAKIVVKAPENVSFDRIESFIKQKKEWIRNQISEVQKYQQAPIQKRFLSGASLVYLGRQYKIIVTKTDQSESVKLSKNQIVIFTKKEANNDIHNGSLVKIWYEKQRTKVFKERFNAVFSLFPNIPDIHLKVREMKNRWGSYRVNGTIVLHPELIKASKQCIDYVICHELCHFYHKKHNDLFYKLLESKMPDWKKTKEKLDMRFTSM